MAHVVVVGAGVFGASVAHRLARLGWDVTLVERFAPGHVRASSGDESRLLRCAHGTDAWYARSARRSRELWRELELQTGTHVFVEAGVAWVARRTDGWEAESEAVLRAAGIPVERLTPEDAAGLFPSFAADDLEFVLLEPEAGILRAREATRLLASAAVAHGARLEVARARPDGAAVVLDDGRRLAGDRVVWACGAWLAGLFPELVELRVTHQDVFYFGAGPEWATPDVPGWVDYDGAAYGLGDLDGRGVKVAPDSEGPAMDLEGEDRVAVPAHEAQARDYLARRFPGLAQAPLVGHRTCQYELTADTHFLVAPHPEHDGRVWLVGGGSGHGFKHGPALAEHLEGLLDGSRTPEPRFGLGPRAPARGLRTAGEAGPRAVRPR
jgi:glycine/D-amino acid oxidase-like deaminating enzyme